MKRDTEVLVVKGVEGLCLYISEYRMAGSKPWGGGTTLHSFKINVEEIPDVQKLIEQRVKQAQIAELEDLWNAKGKDGLKLLNAEQAEYVVQRQNTLVMELETGKSDE